MSEPSVTELGQSSVIPEEAPAKDVQDGLGERRAAEATGSGSPAEVPSSSAVDATVPFELHVTPILIVVALALGLHRPFETAGMILRRIAAHDEHHVGILNVDPAIGHCAPPKRWSQT